jgi:excisionase family DNA binding protein
MPLLNTKEMAEVLQVSTATLLTLVNGGEIPVIRIAEQILRYDETDVMEALKKKEEKTNVE